MTEISRRQFAVYLVAIVVVVLLGGRALRADTAPRAPGAVPAGGFNAAEPEPGATGASRAARGSGATGAGGLELSESSEQAVVHVAGLVRRPGVYTLPAGARISDALDRAGGGRAGADLTVLNLAAKVTDGQQVLVARRGRAGAVGGSAAAGAPLGGVPTGGAAGAASGVGAAGSAPGASSGAAGAAGGTVDVNRADANQLEVLNGVGPAIAAAIVDWRTQNGAFRSVEDLAQVPGIGPKKLEAMRAQVVV